MKIRDYQQLANRTECDQISSLTRIINNAGVSKNQIELEKEVMPTRLLHSCIGMTSDLRELYLAADRINVIEELGDILWYCAEGANALGIVMTCELTNHCPSYEGCLSIIFKYVADYAYALERWLYYGKPEEEQTLRIQLSINYIVSYVNQLALFVGSTLEEVMEKNIAKLRQRFPDKYTDYHADEDNRDREAERKALEETPLSTLQVVSDLDSQVQPTEKPTHFIHNGTRYCIEHNCRPCPECDVLSVPDKMEVTISELGLCTEEPSKSVDQLNDLMVHLLQHKCFACGAIINDHQVKAIGERWGSTQHSICCIECGACLNNPNLQELNKT
jgi:NTP pyrophosphatase (non-canonical NTP hydrolase)